MATTWPKRSRDDSPAYWFVRLETAVGNSDFESAAEAQKQLERLGVRVAFDRNPKTPLSPLVAGATR